MLLRQLFSPYYYTLMKNNPVSRFEIYVNNMERAKTFYTNVLQKWERIDLSNVDMKMDMFAFPRSDGGEGASWALVKMDIWKPSDSWTIVYFGCEDCSVEEARVESNGGKVIQTKNSIGEFGFMALIQDSEGNIIGLHSMK